MELLHSHMSSYILDLVNTRHTETSIYSTLTLSKPHMDFAHCSRCQENFGELKSDTYTPSTQ